MNVPELPKRSAVLKIYFKLFIKSYQNLQVIYNPIYNLGCLHASNLGLRHQRKLLSVIRGLLIYHFDITLRFT